MFASEGESQKQFFVLFLVGEWARVGGGELLGIEKCIAKMRFWKCCTLRGVETQSVFFFSHFELWKCPGEGYGFVLWAIGSRKVAQWEWSFGEVPVAVGGRGSCDAY